MPRIGNVNAVLSVSTSEFTAGLDLASRELSKFGRNVSTAFTENLPTLTPDADLFQIADSAKKAEKALAMPSAREGIKAIGGSLFLLTGQTGFFAVEAARAASHVAKITQEAGGLLPALAAVGGAFNSMLASLGPLGGALLGIGAAYAAIAYFTKKASDAQKELTNSEKASQPLWEKEYDTLTRLRRARKDFSELEIRRMEFRRNLPEKTEFDEGMEKSIRATLAMEREIEGIEKRRKLGRELVAAGRDERLRNQEEIAKRRAAAEEAVSQGERNSRQRMLEGIVVDQKAFDKFMQDRREFAKQAAIAAGVKGSTFEVDPLKKHLMELQERIDELRANPTKIGVDFGVSSATFLGRAPVGDLFGPQREQATMNDHLSEIEDLNRELVNFVKSSGGFGVNID